MVVRHSLTYAVPSGERRCERCRQYRLSSKGKYVNKTLLRRQWLCEFCLAAVDKPVPAL